MTQDQMSPEVFRRLVLDQALATVECSDEERRQFRRQLYRDKSYRVWLQQQDVTIEQLETWIDRELKIRKFQRQRWGKVLGSYFLQRKRQLDQIVCSLIYLPNREIARELYFRIVEGEESFAEVAQAYSQGAAAEAGGLTGPIELGKLHPELARMFYGSRPGRLWEPTAIDQWIVIARLEDFLPVQLDDTMRQILLNELLENWLQDQIKQRFP